MKTQIFSVYDAAVKAYLQPFYVRSRGEAIRSFTDASNDEKNQFKKHAADYTLFFLGEFDDGSGIFSAPGVPERIISSNECIVDTELFPPSRQLPS